ncbi:uncharacterized protein SCHCODRAFT_02034107 [Schizophyllum commune H4-8]|uniref:uncharacterized protein n=1 Tax=Schizophyllum commune (strain H4-8 / FGSC 9210) TaxID=578458 RepID=UPI00215FA1C9|nr:uncharacterized protein SCHCODRAFT_02034107 [Schizophyllum commune H4-8]KAI5900335.1 hypothetical protein SCHCODRAFT_02034107 [Schizophyllum commune H4-8]
MSPISRWVTPARMGQQALEYERGESALDLARRGQAHPVSRCAGALIGADWQWRALPSRRPCNNCARGCWVRLAGEGEMPRGGPAWGARQVDGALSGEEPRRVGNESMRCPKRRRWGRIVEGSGRYGWRGKMARIAL